MSFTFDTASNRVDVWFNLAPSDYRFVNYEIMLINATSQESNQWTQKTEVVVREGVSEHVFWFPGKIYFSSPLPGNNSAVFHRQSATMVLSLVM